MSNQSLCLEQIGIQLISSISEQAIIRLWNGKDIIQDFGETEINSDLYSDYKKLSQLVLILELCPDCYNCVGLLDVGFPLFIQSGTYSTLTVNCYLSFLLDPSGTERPTHPTPTPPPSQLPLLLFL